MSHPLRQWVRRLFTTVQPPRRREKPTFRPLLELLEARITPSVTFAGQQTFGVGNNSTSVAMADFNGDGRPDLAVANYDDGTVSVLLNVTAAGANAPSFTLQITFAVGGAAMSVAAGDFNGDGRPDLAVANNNNSGTVSVLLNTTAAGAAAPSFATAMTFAVGALPTSVAAGDFNGDGRPDLAVVNSTVGTVSVLLDTTAAGAAAPSFAAQQTFAVGREPISAAVGDFNGDGRPDLAVANSADDTASVLLDTTAAGAAPSFATAMTFGVGSFPTSVTAGDFNGDGRPDLAVGNFNDGTVSFLLNTTPAGAGAPSFAAQQTFGVGSFPTSVAAGDFNGDGRPDLAVTNNGSRTASVVLNTTAAGAATPSFAAQQTFGAGAFPAFVAVGDFNGDGRPDLAVANQGDNTVSVLLNTTMPFVYTTPVVVGDFTGHGIYEFNRATQAWVNINVSDVSVLAANAAGEVVADFPHYGVYEYGPFTGVWTILDPSTPGASSGPDAALLAIDASGDVVGDFTHSGLWEHLASSGWVHLLPSDPSLLAADANGDIFAEFPHYGVWTNRRADGSWTQLTSMDAASLAVNAQGMLVVGIAGVGVQEYLPLIAAPIHIAENGNPQAMAIDAYGDITLSYQTAGIFLYRPAVGVTRGQLPTPAVLLAADAKGDEYADFSGQGVWEFDAFRGWYQLPQPGTTGPLGMGQAPPFGDAALLVVA